MSKWKPKYGETFWYVSEVLEAEGTTWEDDAIDLEFYKSGNCFYTVEEAEAAAEKVKALLLSLHDDGENLQENNVTLPDWCKPGAWVWSSDFGFFLVSSIKDGAIKGECPGYGEIFVDYHSEKIEEAYIRPFDNEEMKNLVGKILVNKETKDINLVTDYINEVDEDDPSYHYCTVYVGGENMVAEDLFEDFTIDGYPCGQLERKDNHDDNF